MLCLSGFELYSLWVPLNTRLPPALQETTEKGSFLWGVSSYSLKFYFYSVLHQTSVHLCRPLIRHVRGENKPERPNVPQQLFQRLPVAPSSR